MQHLFIDVKKTKGWIVVRTFPTLVCPAFPKLSYHFMEVWRGTMRDKWYCGYVEDNDKYRDKASVFSTYDLAVQFIEQFRGTDESVEFCVMPTDRSPTISKF